MSDRKSYEESCQHLMELGWIEEIPPLPTAPPKNDDSLMGLSFYRTRMEDENENEPFEGLTIPRTFISRTVIDVFSFSGSDLTESTVNWNNIEDTSFMNCILQCCDLRANSFEACELV